MQVVGTICLMRCLVNYLKTLLTGVAMLPPGEETMKPALIDTDIWDSIARNNDKLPMQEWQNVELDKRYNDYKNGKLKLHGWEDVHEGLRNEYKSNCDSFCS